MLYFYIVRLINCGHNLPKFEDSSDIDGKLYKDSLKAGESSLCHTRCRFLPMSLSNSNKNFLAQNMSAPFLLLLDITLDNCNSF